MSKTLLTDLPSELLLRILHLLQPNDIENLGVTCRLFRSTVEYSHYAQYSKQLALAGLTDDFPLDSGFTFHERLDALKRRECAWAGLLPQSSTTLPITFRTSDVHGLDGGVLFLGHRDDDPYIPMTRGLYYTTLPSSLSTVNNETRAVCWSRIELESLDILDIGLAIEEHNLVAVLTNKPNPNVPWDPSLLELYLFSASSAGQPHPLASKHLIPISSRDLVQGNCNVHIEIVGDYLGLLVSYPWAVGETACDAFYLLHWKTGKFDVVVEKIEKGTYDHFIFLREDILLFPRPRDSSIQIFKIITLAPASNPYLQSLLILRFPDVGPADIMRITCHSGHGPLACASDPRDDLSSHSTTSAPHQSRARLFRENPSSSIVLFNIILRGHAARYVNHPRISVLVVHRALLLSHLSNDELVLPFGPISKASIREDYRKTTQGLNWDDWTNKGKDVRWFEGEEERTPSILWTPSTVGARWTTLRRCEGSSKTTGDEAAKSEFCVVVRDFNQHRVKEMVHRIGNSVERVPWGEGTVTLTRRVVVENTGSHVDGLFTAPLQSSLPYVETRVEGLRGYDGVMMDEQRIIGLQLLGANPSLRSVDVHAIA